MKDELIEFLEWIRENVDDIFEIIDDQEELVKRYLEDKEQD